MFWEKEAGLSAGFHCLQKKIKKLFLFNLTLIFVGIVNTTKEKKGDYRNETK